ncbi:SLOG family protein [Brucella anthropi]|uniref:SLOG family protein n=1 Tax=Brucella anthropi TaxID=529 RepID=UPI000F65C669|nr:SLOG family protein [Brucella anthropi]RRY08877.1 DUF2493 domain-containing protein [Brucella anthropi]
MNKGVWIVCGGRHYVNEARVYQILDAARERLGLVFVVDGGGTGADALARQWRGAKQVDGETYPADWTNLSHPDAIIRERSDGTKYDALAGARRNQKMLEETQPEGVIAFRGGPGTHDMIKRAEKAGLRVIRIDWE